MSRHSRFAFPALVMACCVTCAAEESAAELIGYLTGPSSLEAQTVIDNPCGCVRAERRDALALASLGDAALPEIEKVLNKVDSGRGTLIGLSWLELAHARIKGPAAYERLRGLELNSKTGSDGPFGFDSGRRNLDGAIALSLGLTSFVSALGSPSVVHAEPFRALLCGKGEQPRVALDAFIKALERNDDFSFQARLGPDAKAALDSILKNETWSELRAGLLREGKPLSDFAIGYLFDAAGPWSEPAETLSYRSPRKARRVRR